MWSWVSFVIGVIVGVVVGVLIGIGIMAVVSYGKCAQCEEDRSIPTKL